MLIIVVYMPGRRLSYVCFGWFSGSETIRSANAKNYPTIIYPCIYTAAINDKTQTKKLYNVLGVLLITESIFSS